MDYFFFKGFIRRSLVKSRYVGPEGKQLPTWEQEFPGQVPVLNYVIDFKRVNEWRVGYRVAHLR